MKKRKSQPPYLSGIAIYTDAQTGAERGRSVDARDWVRRNAIFSEGTPQPSDRPILARIEGNRLPYRLVIKNADRSAAVRDLVVDFATEAEREEFLASAKTTAEEIVR